MIAELLRPYRRTNITKLVVAFLGCFAMGARAFVSTQSFSEGRVFITVDGSMCQFSIRNYSAAAVYNRYWKLWWRTPYENGCHEVQPFRSEKQNILLNAIVYFLSWNPSCVRYINIRFKNMSPVAVLTAATEISGFHLHVHNNNTNIVLSR